MILARHQAKGGPRDQGGLPTNNHNSQKKASTICAGNDTILLLYGLVKHQPRVYFTPPNLENHPSSASCLDC